MYSHRVMWLCRTDCGLSSESANDATMPRFWSWNSFSGTASSRMRAIWTIRSRNAASVTSVRTSVEADQLPRNLPADSPLYAP